MSLIFPMKKTTTIDFRLFFWVDIFLLLEVDVQFYKKIIEFFAEICVLELST